MEKRDEWKVRKLVGANVGMAAVVTDGGFKRRQMGGGWAVSWLQLGEILEAWVGVRGEKRSR